MRAGVRNRGRGWDEAGVFRVPVRVGYRDTMQAPMVMLIPAHVAGSRAAKSGRSTACGVTSGVGVECVRHEFPVNPPIFHERLAAVNVVHLRVDSRRVRMC